MQSNAFRGRVVADVLSRYVLPVKSPPSTTLAEEVIIRGLVRRCQEDISLLCVDKRSLRMPGWGERRSFYRTNGKKRFYSLGE